MPNPDPTPASERSLKRRFWRLFRLLVQLSIVIAAIAVLLVTRGAGEISIHLVIATALGVGFTVLLGTSLMTLVFLSADTGHDDQAAPRVHRENEKK